MLLSKITEGATDYSWSFYNLIFKVDGEHILFNALNGNICEISENVRKILENGHPSLLPHDIFESLKSNGFISPYGQSELHGYLKEYEDSKIRGGRLSLKVFLAEGCNLGCPYCYQSAPSKSANVMSSSTLSRLLAWIRAELSSGITGVDLEFYGGEPLLARGPLGVFIRDVTRLKEDFSVPINFSIITNATLLNDELIGVFMANNITMQITLDGTRTTHDKRRFYKGSQKGSYDTIVKKLYRIREMGASHLVRLRMNVDAENVHDVEAVAQLATDLGIVDFSAARIHFREKETNYEPAIPRLVDIEAGLDSPEMIMFRAMSKFGFADSPVSLDAKTTCMYHWHRGFAVSPTLHLFKCDELIDYPEYSVGFIDEDGALNIKSTAYQKAVGRKPSDFAHCESCRFLPQCGSGCSIRALNTKGSPDTNYCEETSQSVHAKVALYVRASRAGFLPDSIKSSSGLKCACD